MVENWKRSSIRDNFLSIDETELCYFFGAITALSLFILCLYFLEGVKKKERGNNGDKKMHGVPFHPVLES